MSSFPINLNSKAFIQTYVQTALYEAGLFLEETPAPAVLTAATAAKWINPDVRPIVLNYTDNHTDNSWNWDWSARTTNTHTYSAPQERAQTADEKKKAEEEARGKRDSIMGGLFLVVATFVTRYTYKGYARQQESFNYTSAVKSAVEWMDESLIKDHLVELVIRQYAIDKTVLVRMKNCFRAAAVGLASSAAIFLGGFIRQRWVSNMGYIGLLATALGAAWIFADHLGDKAKIRRHYEFIAGDKRAHNGWANYILSQDLPQYDDEMHLLRVIFSGAVYQPLFPQFGPSAAESPWVAPPGYYQPANKPTTDTAGAHSTTRGD